MVNNLKKIKYNYFYFLLVLLPIVSLVSYLLISEISEEVDYRAYPSIIIFGILMYLNKKSLNSYIILTIFLIYSLFNKVGTFSAGAGYMMDYCLTCLTLFTLPKIKFNKINIKIIDNSIFIFCYSIIISYLLTLNINESNGYERVYLVGFIIPHAFSYMMAIFVYYFMKRKKIILAIIPFLLGCFAGTRTGLLLSLLTVVSVLLNGLTIKKIIIYFFYFVSFVILLNFIVNKSPIIKNQFDSISNAFNDFSFSTSTNDQKSIDFSSHRSLLFALGLDQINKDGISYENIIGRGPRASYIFNDNKTGSALWFHNDFMEILFSLGVINLIFYLFAIFKYYFYTKNTYFLIFVLFSAFTNGFFFYYSFVIIGIHYLSIYFEIHENSSDK
jgi:hypothetical protein